MACPAFACTPPPPLTPTPPQPPPSLTAPSWDRLTAVWLLPVVPGVVASASGGLVAQYCSVTAAEHIILACGYL